jgi:hypothetical protein
MDVLLERIIVRNDYAFTSGTAAVFYDSIARDVVHRFKFTKLRALSASLAPTAVALLRAALRCIDTRWGKIYEPSLLAVPRLR